ncbi:hypothetical protein A8H39_18610 [Paraburkholderia fungorum]|nr:hypothetical protein A8H39_18610 [Paraburkholderia fungorum]
MADRSFKNLSTAGLDAVIDKLPTNTGRSKKTVHFVSVAVPPTLTFLREHLDQIVDFKPFAIVDEFSNLAIDIGKLRPIIPVRRPVKDLAQDPSYVVWLKARSICDLDCRFAHLCRSVIPDCDLRVRADETLTLRERVHVILLRSPMQ